MKIIFQSMKLHNFMSYQDAEVLLNRKGFIIVSGINNNPEDSAKSNGTGKSSLFSAISWALTGFTVQGSKDVTNIYLSGTTVVELNFKLDKHDYRLIRSKNPSNLKLFIDNEDRSGKGIRDTEKILQEYLPDLTYTLLNSVIILGQGLPQKFTNNSPSGRKEVLEKLSNSDFLIQDLKSRVNQRNEQLKNELRNEEDALLTATTTLKLLNEEITALKSELDSLTDDYYSKLVYDQSQAVESELRLKQDIQHVDELIEELQEKNISIQSNIQSKYQEYYNTVESNIIAQINALDTDIATLNYAINDLTNEIKTLELVVDVCPTCGQKLPNVTKIDTTDKKVTLKTLQEDLKHKLEDRDNKKLYQQNQRNVFELSQADLNAELKNIQTQIQAYTTERKNSYTTLTNVQVKLEKLNYELTKFEAQKQSIQLKIEKNENQVNILQNSILCYNTNINTFNMRLDINSKMNSMLARDFRGYLLLGIIDFISKHSKQYALELFGTDKLDFGLDGNNIFIKYDNKDYEVLSGGEQQKVDVILQFAIRDMLCKYLNFSSNILVLDEITDSLDIVGSQKMFNLIANKLNDVEAIYIISHHQDDFEVPYDEQILITKGADKISRIKT